jgi:dTDP-4-amino-4,6-dideoxygalactose transaminase
MNIEEAGKIKFQDLFFFNSIIKDEFDTKINEIIKNSSFINGPDKFEFEENFARFCDANYCIGVGNCTDALEICIEALNLPKGSEIIVPSNSFIATSEAVTRSGYKVVFADCNKDNYTISLSSIENSINANTSAIIAVHLYGHPCDIDEIKKLIKGKEIAIIEDCAQSHGALYKGKKTGSLGDISAFSFYPGKNLGAFGDAGAIITNNKILANKCRMIANHGRTKKYNHEFEGRNSRLDNIQAAVLNIKLRYLEEMNLKRIKNASIYIKELQTISKLFLPKIEDWAKPVFHQFVIRTKTRNDLIDFLNKNGIEIGIHYPIALPKLAAYKYYKGDTNSFNSMKYDSQILSLPVSEHLDEKDIFKIIDVIKSFFNEQ